MEKSSSAIITKESNFKGDTEDINGFLSLSKEHSTTGHEGFTHFQKQLEAYVLREYDNPNDIMPLILKLVDPIPVYEVSKPSTSLTAEQLTADPVASLMLTEEVKTYSNGLKKLKANMTTLWGHIWGQEYTPFLQAEVEADDDYQDKRANYESDTKQRLKQSI